MGLFSRSKQSIQNPEDCIPCDKFIRTPPEQYEKPDGIEPITSAQHEKYLSVLHYFQENNLLLPVKSGRNSEGAETLELCDWEKFWITRECILRYLRATSWNVETAISRICKTIVWRREFKVTGDKSVENRLDADTVENENRTGKQLMLGFDRERRPIYMMKNGRQNTEPSFSQVQHLVYFMECVITMMPQGVELLVLLIDYKHYKEPGIISASSPPISLARQILNIIQDHYPERLGKALFVNMPWYGWTFLKLMHPFIDPTTRSKLVYDKPLVNYVDEDQLEVNYGGKLDFVYNHDIYWPDFTEAVEERQQNQFQRFLKFGGCVGLSEFDIKGDHDELLYPPDYKHTI
ncbi:HCL599Cp [Eremothecium sinecaudum]|uniref:SEC14 homolog 3 n=1 Tax=Eremothecium sinecaudum TaxID=45286 RepID=A0A109UYM4_9SACH|nr:HCL599Cp [Eremothecium sinecaudum]AMD19552.1 HCL599Cp [Eremothecium sinecaudum]